MRDRKEKEQGTVQAAADDPAVVHGQREPDSPDRAAVPVEYIVEDAVDGDGKVVDLDLAEVIGVDVLVTAEEHLVVKLRHGTLIACSEKRCMINVMVEGLLAGVNS
jgi:hypothetical protein